MNNVNSSNPKEAPFYLIVGCPRSGTTLAVREIGKRYSVGFPYDSHFIPVFFRWIEWFGDLGKRKNRIRLLNAIYRFEELWIRQFNGTEKDQVRNFSLLATHPEATDIINASYSYSTLIKAIFDTYARRQGRLRSGAKIVEYDYVPIDDFSLILPNLKVIHIIRDGRDVYLSWRRTWFGPQSPTDAARAWCAHIEGIRAWGQNNPDRYAEIFYERLIENPDFELERIKPLFNDGVKESSENPEQTGMFEAIGSAEEHRLIRKPIDPSNHKKWRIELNQTETAIYERVAGNVLTNLGYEPSLLTEDIQRSTVERSFRGILSTTRLRQRAKAFLPLLMLLTSKNKLPE